VETLIVIFFAIFSGLVAYLVRPSIAAADTSTPQTTHDRACGRAGNRRRAPFDP
jgi:hypothetical protein